MLHEFLGCRGLLARGLQCCVGSACCCYCLPALQDDQTSQQLATQACGFITIVSGTFLLHTTKDLDLTGVSLEHMLDRKEAAMGSSTMLGQGSVVQRRPAGAASVELGTLEGAKADAAEKGASNGTAGSKDGDDEHHPLIGEDKKRKPRGFGSIFG